MKKKLFLAIFLFTVLHLTAAAQATPEQQILSARDQFSDIKNRSLELERMKREAGSRPASKDFTPIFPAIKEDFERIQKINSSIVQLITAQTPVNYAAILKYSSEINRRAARLGSNLFSAEFDGKIESKDKQIIAESRLLKPLLEMMDKSINSFAHNELFKNLNIVNPTDSLKAQKDLETVIKISFQIKEQAKKLTKNNSEK